MYNTCSKGNRNKYFCWFHWNCSLCFRKKRICHITVFFYYKVPGKITKEKQYCRHGYKSAMTSVRKQHLKRPANSLVVQYHAESISGLDTKSPENAMTLWRNITWTDGWFWGTFPVLDLLRQIALWVVSGPCQTPVMTNNDMCTNSSMCQSEADRSRITALADWE